MENHDVLLETLRNKIAEVLNEIVDADLLDYILKLLIIETR